MKTPVDFQAPASEGDRYVFIITRDPAQVAPVCWQAFPAIERESAMHLFHVLKEEYQDRSDREVYCIEGRWQAVLAEHGELLGTVENENIHHNWRH